MSSKPSMFVIVRVGEKGHTRAFLSDRAAQQVQAAGISDDAFNAMKIEIGEVEAAAPEGDRRQRLIQMRKRMVEKLGQPAWIDDAHAAVAAYQAAQLDTPRRNAQEAELFAADAMSAFAHH